MILDLKILFLSIKCFSMQEYAKNNNFYNSSFPASQQVYCFPAIGLPTQPPVS